jgi:hypothetical protein
MLRAEQQAQEAKEVVLRQEVIISSPFMFTTTPVLELFGRHGKQHWIEELSPPQQSYRDCILFFGQNSEAETAFRHHLDLRFELAGVHVLFGQDVK